jgi:hypothetical protein
VAPTIAILVKSAEGNGEENENGSFYVDFGCVDAEVVRMPRSARVTACLIWPAR